MREEYVIIGDGIAALSAVKSIREHDKESTIHMYGEEKFYPYNRVRLSKGLFTALKEDKILLQKKEWYELNKVNLHLDVKATGIDTDSKNIILEDGNTVHYSKLLIANGAKNFAPPIEGINKKGIFTLKKLGDAWNILEYAHKSKKILNIGGGIQGIETAWILSQHHKKTAIIEIAPKLMPRQLDDKGAHILTSTIEKHNVDIILGAKISEIMGDDKVEGIKTEDGKIIECDMIIYSTGISPNIDILKDTAIKTNFGIIVNDRMETSMPDIYSAGDIAEYEGEVYGLWNIAIAQGTTAGYNMAKKDHTYEPVAPVTTLNAFGLSMFSMGIVNESKAEHSISDINSGDSLYRKVYFKNNNVIGAIIIGDTKKSPILKRAIEQKTDLSSVDLSNTSIDEIFEIIKEKK